MTLTPGYGTDHLHLRESSDRIKHLFGEPAKRRKTGSFREYWLYPDHHFDCIVSRTSGAVLSLLLYSGKRITGDEEFALTEARVREMYGPPVQEGGGFRLATGDYVNRWLTYDMGIGFDFNAANRLQTISIFAPKKKPATKRAGKLTASHGAHTQQIAALLAGKVRISRPR